MPLTRRTLLKSTFGLATTAFLAKQVMASPEIPVSSDIKDVDPSAPLLLNFNENALGISPMAKHAMIESLNVSNLYPDQQLDDLRTALSHFYQITPEHITLGNGSSEIIQAVIECVYAHAMRQNKSMQVVVPDPTFNYAELYAKTWNIPVHKVPLTTTMAFDLDAMGKVVDDFDGLSLVYLCNPNNPTSTLLPTKNLSQWFKKHHDSAIFLFDEAYAEYVTDEDFISGIHYIKQGVNNVIVTRTFSKFYAMAGLRLGYAINSNTELDLSTFISIDNINLMAAVAGIASLHHKDFQQLSLLSNLKAKKIVTDTLTELGLPFLPSQANFIFHKITGEYATYRNRMKEHNIFVGREFPPLLGWSRLTLGKPEQMVRFCATLKRFRQNGWI